MAIICTVLVIVLACPWATRRLLASRPRANATQWRGPTALLRIFTLTSGMRLTLTLLLPATDCVCTIFSGRLRRNLIYCIRKTKAVSFSKLVLIYCTYFMCTCVFDCVVVVPQKTTLGLLHAILCSEKRQTL